jgi:hypothetical protein
MYNSVDMYRVIHVVKITFGSWDELMEQERINREAADKRIQPWHYKLRAGDVVISDPGYGFPIFHELLDNEKLVGENFKKYGDEYEGEGQYILDLYCFGEEPWNYRFCRNYSEVVTDGELGDIHLSIALGKIDKEVFEGLKGKGFDLTDYRIVR